MTFSVRYSASARDDLKHLYEFLLERSTTAEGFDLAEKALATIANAAESLSRSPFIYRKAGTSAFLRC